MKHRGLLALPMLLLAQCAPTCAPATPVTPPPPAEISVPALGSGTTPYRLPVADVSVAGWGTTHAEYTATDIFVRCGAQIVSPVNGVVVESRRVNAYDPNVDDPATRGGRSVAIVGDDGVRYYMAHFEQIDAAIEPGVRVQIGQLLGLMGMTGRASACHVHFALSPPCPGPEWSVRRGVIWPYRYLDDWRAGGQRSPVAEIQQWVADHPDGCALAMADPYAGHA
jgi:murein DD-endopeptidase MepM/ murein hydrolase activator NlpD